MQLPGIEKIAQVVIGAHGRLLVSDFDDEAIRIFQCTPAQDSHVARCTADAVASGRPSVLGFDDERSVVALGFEDGSLRIVGFGDDKFDISPQLGDLKRVVSLAFSNDGKHLGIGTLDGRTIVTDAHGGIPVEAPTGTTSISAMAWDPAGRRLATTCDGFEICVWRLPEDGKAGSTLERVARLGGHLDIVRSLGIAPNGTTLASASNDGTIRLWTIDQPDRSYFTLDAGKDTSLNDLDLSADQRWMAAADDGGGLYVWRLSTLALETASNVSETEIETIGWSPRNSNLAAGNKHGHVTIRAFPFDAKQQSFDVAGEVYALRWLPDGSAVLTSGGVDGAIDVHSAEGDPLPKFTKGHDDAVLALVVTGNGKTLLSADAFGKVQRWDVATRKLSGAPRDAHVSRDTISISHDGSRFLVAGNDGDVLIFRLDNNVQPAACHSGSQQLDAAAFSPDDRVVAAISADAVLYLWSLGADCSILASAPLLVANDASRSAGQTAHRRHLIFLPDLKTIAVTASTREVTLIAFDPDAWLQRVRKLATTGAGR